MKLLGWIFLGTLMAGAGWAREEAIRDIDCSHSSVESQSASAPRKILRSGRTSPPDETKIRFTMRSHGPKGTRNEEVLILPNVALRLRDGWLVGLDNGEWGGTLKFKSRQSEIEILSENVLDIFAMPFGYAVVTGLAQLGSNEGALYVIQRKGTGFRAEKLFELPGVPNRTLKVDGGLLLIAEESPPSYTIQDDGTFVRVSENLGSYLLRDDGALRRVRCSREKSSAN